VNLDDLAVEVDSYELEGRSAAVSSAFTRHTTVIHLSGAGEEGLGEDTTYDADDQHAFQQTAGQLDLRGSHTLGSFPRLLEGMSTYRRWGFESAALDLALRQASRSLADALEREPRPLTFVVSLRLGDPPSIEPVQRRLELYPSMRFKLDPTSSWDGRLVEELVQTNAVVTLDLKGAYEGTAVDQPADPRLYALVAEAFPHAWIEDPKLTPETEPVLRPHRDRITWDAPIHSVADIEALPFRPRTINIKPSRIGNVRELLETYDYLEANGIGAYGGGQSELGPGRGQIQYLASLFHPDAPNDVAPSAYNAPEPTPGLPESPLEPPRASAGFRYP
jgi:hypothetical protein